MTPREQGTTTVDTIKPLSQRIADAVTMFTVSVICLVLLLFVAHGTVTKTYEQLITEKLLASAAIRAEEQKHSSPQRQIEAGLALVQKTLADAGITYDEFVFSL